MEETSLFRPSRTSYPGSKFGPKTRYDLPQRRKAYGNADEQEVILFSGTSLQPQTWPAPASSGGGAATPRGLGAAVATPRGTAPREASVFTDVGRSMFHPLAEHNLPELPLIDEKNDVHGVLVLGGKGCGKTSFILSLKAVLSGTYPHGAEVKEKKNTMPTYGQVYELPERDVRLGGGTVKSMRVVLTDTPPCGTKGGQDEQPLCATVSPNSVQSYNAIPSWMRITLRKASLPHYAVLFVIDATAEPLWEDGQRCRELARLLAVLKRNQYTVVIAVTKLPRARDMALRDVAHGHAHGGQVGRDPRSSYESFASRYIDRVVSCIQAKAGENDWTFSSGPGSPPFPLPNATIFDVPTWVSLLEFQAWQSRTGTATLPNMKYATNQIQRLLNAISVRSHPE